jgi:hypothetical protein
MPTLASQLVQFLMSLFNNPHAAQAFLADPEQALSDAGLADVCAADVDAAMPVVLDYAPITISASSFDRQYNTGGNAAWTGHNGGHGSGFIPPLAGGGSGNYLNDHAQTVQQLQQVVNNYSYSSIVDDRDTVTDQSVNQNIWADGDVSQFFDNHATIAHGDHAMAAGDDIDFDDSFNLRDSSSTDNSVDNSTDYSVTAGRDANIGTTDVDDAFNTDSSIDDSFNTDFDLDVADSFNDSSDNSADNSHNSVDIYADLEDVGNTDNSVSSTVDNSVELENVGNTDNSVAVDMEFEDFDNTYTDESVTVGHMEDNVVAAVDDVAAVDNEGEF